MDELPNATAGQSLYLDAKGKGVVMEYFADGEIFFWSEDDIYLEFDAKNVEFLLAALCQQERLLKSGRAISAPSKHVGPSLDSLDEADLGSQPEADQAPA